MSPPLYAHQRAALGRLLERQPPADGWFALAPMEMGTGKSAVIVHEAVERSRLGQLVLVVVVAPNGVHRKWAEREFPLHGELRAHAVESGWPQPRFARLRNTLLEDYDRQGTAVVCLGYGACSTRTAAWSFVERLVQLAGPRAMLVLDESHYVKTPSAARTRNLWKLGKRARFRRILSGTPVTRGLEDLYAQWRFLSPDVLGFRTFAEFKAAHCVMGGYEFREIVDYQRVPQLLSRLAPHSFAVRKEACLDLPAKSYERWTVEMSPPQRAHYTSIRDEFLMQLEAGDVDVPLAITRLIRLQQVLGGHVGEGSALSPIDCPRLDLTVELVKEALESEQQVIVWARFQVEIDRLLAELTAAKIAGVRRYHGGMSVQDRATALRAFQEERTSRILVATQASGGVGLDLTAASTVIYYSNTFNYADRAQSEDRCHRIGQTRPVAYHDLVCPGTLDAKILRTLAERRDLADVVAGGKVAIRGLLSTTEEQGR